MTKGRIILIVAQVLATLLFVSHYRANADQQRLSWLTPLVVLILIIINSIWFTRFVSWLIFAVSFFALMVVLSAFTIRWRLEPGFSPIPFYRAIFLYTMFVYISLGQIKLIGGASHAQPPQV